MKGWDLNSLEKLKAKGMVAVFNESTRSIIVKENTEMLKKVKRSNRHEESDLQINCVETFRLIYPKYRWRLFAIPNGGKRGAMEAARLVKEGVLPGALDLFLAVPRPEKKAYGLFIEMKTQTGRLSEHQVNFINEIKEDYAIVVCRSVEGFLREVGEYLGG